MKTKSISLVVLTWFTTMAFAVERPELILDFTRIEAPYGTTRLPAGLLERVALPTDRLALTWLVVDENDRVRVRLRDTEAHRVGDTLIKRVLVLEVPDLETYREAVGDHAELALSRELVEVLRERRREVGLGARFGAAGDGTVGGIAARPTFFEDHRVKGALPKGYVPTSIELKSIEQNGDGEIKLAMSGVGADDEAFTTSVTFADLDDFNFTSGQGVTKGDLNRQSLSFWVTESRMSGKYVMKTRDEIARQCAALLEIGIGESREKPASERSNAGEELGID